MTKKPLAADQDKFVLRLPEGMRDRIAKSAEENGRSMNAEIVQALAEHFPPEPSVYDVLDRVHRAIDQARSPNAMPYRQTLIDALEQLSQRLSTGLEYTQSEARTMPEHAVGMDDRLSRMDRWRRAEKYGVELADLQREIDRGLFKGQGGSRINQAIRYFKDGKADRALKLLRLDKVKFADPEASHKAIDTWLRSYYADNWGDPDAPWDFED